MSLELTEEEMRQALFGASGSTKSSTNAPKVCVGPKTLSEVELSQVEPKRPSLRKPKPKPLSPKLRVTLSVAKVFDGEREVFVHAADTLSTILAEQEARKAAQKKRFKYFDLISIEPF